MTEREQKITSILHRALERAGVERRAFLDGACAGDEELRREVESLIRSHEQAGAELHEQGNFADRHLGHYRIVRKLGGGGMGEVYLAEDTRLGRRVAIKILPRRLTTDASLVARFRQEARAASTLNHPNIVTIYEVGEVDGIHFIATELVEGHTLREHIVLKQVSVGEALDIATQVTAALAKAHQGGVVHRDVKPENIMLDSDGHAKVLDFGIAKLTEQAPSVTTEAPTMMKVDTSPGVVMGTAHYMSPEQARALRDIDARTDVWSVGVVLYEMLAGRQPFEGASTQDVMSMILNKEPQPLARFNREVPESLDLVVQKSLAKDRDERYQTAKEFTADLKRVRQRLDTGATANVENQKVDSTSTHSVVSQTQEPAQVHTTSSAEYIVTEIKRHKWGVLAAIALVCLAGVAYAVYNSAFKATPKQPAHFERVKLTRITTEGNLLNVTVSKDGKYIAYSLLEDGKRSLWTKHLATDSRVQIVAPLVTNVMTPYFFSHDGGYVFYGQQEGQHPFAALFRVPVLGGTAKRILTDFASPVGLSPDGRALAFARYQPGLAAEQYQIWVSEVDGTNQRKVWKCSEPQWLGLNGVSWSPDSKLLTFDYGSEEGGDHMTVATVVVADATFKVITQQTWAKVGRIAWFEDGSGMAVAARDYKASNWQIWRVSYPSGEAARITNDLHSYGFTSLTLTSETRTLVAVQAETTAAIWIAPDGDAHRARAIISKNSIGGFDWMPDGRLLFTSIDGGTNIWLTNVDGGEQKLLLEDGDSPQVAPDGRYVFFESRRSKTQQIWRVDADGSHPKQLTDGTGVEAFALTPDGRSVIYALYNPTIWKISVDGGPPVKLADAQAFILQASPDGKLLAYAGLDIQTNRQRLTIVTLDGAPVKTFDLPVTAETMFSWSPNNTNIIYVDTRGGVSNLWKLPLDGSAPSQITDFKSDYIRFFDYSRDGKQLAVLRGSETRDAVIITNEER